MGAVSGAATGAVTHRLTTGSWSGAGQAAVDGAATGFMTGAISGAVTGALTSPYCFVAGTAVLTSAGAVAIETIQKGDLVWAWDEETDTVALRPVIETYVNETKELVHMIVNGEEIVSTPGHPFYSPDSGWIQAGDLAGGDVLVLINGDPVVIELVWHEELDKYVLVFNLNVDEFHTYYVANSGVLVHNKCLGYKPIRENDYRAVINPGEIEAKHAHIFHKHNNLGRIFLDGKTDPSLQANKEAMRFVKRHYKEIMKMIGNYYGKR